MAFYCVFFLFLQICFRKKKNKKQTNKQTNKQKRKSRNKKLSGTAAMTAEALPYRRRNKKKREKEVEKEKKGKKIKKRKSVGLMFYFRLGQELSFVLGSVGFVFGLVVQTQPLFTRLSLVNLVDWPVSFNIGFLMG